MAQRHQESKLRSSTKKKYWTCLHLFSLSFFSTLLLMISFSIGTYTFAVITVAISSIQMELLFILRHWNIRLPTIYYTTYV